MFHWTFHLALPAEDSTFPSVCLSFFSCTRAPTETLLGSDFAINTPGLFESFGLGIENPESPRGDLTVVESVMSGDPNNENRNEQNTYM